MKPRSESAYYARPEPEMPLFRVSDPQTSRLAAESVKLENLGRIKDGILEILKEYGPQTDEYIAAVYEARVAKGMYPKHSPSGLRTRRSWLWQKGFIRSTGRFGKTQSGRDSIIWELAK